ncbi:MAG: anti-phage protein KwaA [Bacteroidia bacterium]
MWQKFEFYIISLFFLFFLIFINKVPINFSSQSEFVGFKLLFTSYLLITVCIVFMLFGVLFFLKFKYNFEAGSSLLPIKVTEIENINFESVTFLATYIVPLACIDMDKDRSALMLIIILILIGWIYIKTNLFYTNPTLAVWGYHIYKISSEKKKNITIITRKRISIGDDLFLKNIDDKIFLAKHQI